MASPVILLLGAGPNIGHGIANKFASQGFKVAVASRNGGGAAGTDWLGIKADFTQPSSVKSVFYKVKSELGMTFPAFQYPQMQQKETSSDVITRHTLRSRLCCGWTHDAGGRRRPIRPHRCIRLRPCDQHD